MHRYWKKQGIYYTVDGVIPDAVELTQEQYEEEMAAHRAKWAEIDRHVAGEIELDELPEEYREEAILEKELHDNPSLSAEEALNIITGNE